MDDRAIARWRLHSLHLAGQAFASPQDAGTGLLAVQAENHPQASWAVATRTSGVTEREFGDIFDRGEVLRTHVLRPTWHFVRPDDEGLAELVLRYFTGHGPATERDLAYWAGMTLTDVRAGLAEVADQFAHVELDGRTYWYGQPPPEAQELKPRGHLLQILDEYHNGYQDSRGVLDADGIVPPGRAANVGMVLLDGQMVGGMRRTPSSDEVTFEANLFRDLDDGEHEAPQAAAARYGRFLGLEGRRCLGQD